MNKVLIIAEHDGNNLNISTARTVTASQGIAESVEIVIFADKGNVIATQAAAIAGVAKVLVVENPANKYAISAILAPQIETIANEYSHIFAPNTTFGKDLMPRVAALLGVPQISNIMRVDSPNIFDRPVYAGNAIVTVEVPNGIVVGTIRTASFPEAAGGGLASIEQCEIFIDVPTHTRFISLEANGDDNHPDLQAASRVIAGGRGLGSQENFNIIYSLADKMGAAVGASRAAVDAGFIPNSHQVGQTGKIIAPELYMAIGISGAIQHLAGIKDARTIVAINKDADAPIFEVADIGLVGDLFTIIPKIEKALG
ncbi:MAG: electron transfer flavoprotein subunit alpha/FixB family protein [Porticoccus sp.]|nr:electron transfer flavoprotein subunit alpha/FixB family protein [Porticoccus sp.]